MNILATVDHVLPGKADFKEQETQRNDNTWFSFINLASISSKKSIHH